MVGQDKLINQINELSIDTFPQSIILNGFHGCGKHSLINYISNKFNLRVIDITDMINKDILFEIYSKIESCIYIIDIDTLSIKVQNAILKFIEEPPINAFIIFITEHKNNIIPTILNRCQLWSFEPYPKQLLQTFIKNDNNSILIDLFNTPGDILFYESQIDVIYNMMEMCNKIIDKIYNASIPNTLTISDKLYYKEPIKDKWDYNCFITVLLFKIKQRLLMSYTNKLFNLYVITSKLLQDSNIPHIDKKKLFDNYLLSTKCIMKE